LPREATPRRLQTAIRALEEAREKAGAELLAALRAPRYVALLDLLVDLIRDPPLTDAACAPAMDVLPPMVHENWKRLRSRVDRLGLSPSHRELHRIRIEAKRVRYAAEGVIPVAGKPARAFVKKAVALQDALGDARDVVLAEAWLQGRSGHVEMDEAESSRPGDEPWRTAWDELNRKKLRSWMRG
jgi:CHAD domain-containing protein